MRLKDETTKEWKDRCYILLALKMEEVGPIAEECWQPFVAGKGK
jgi:hypothetical protein